MIKLTGRIYLKHRSQQDGVQGADAGVYTVEESGLDNEEDELIIESNELTWESGSQSQESIFAGATNFGNEMITVEVTIAPYGRAIREIKLDSDRFVLNSHSLKTDWLIDQMHEDEPENSRCREGSDEWAELEEERGVWL